MGQPDVLTYTEFLSQLPSGSIVACDPKLMGAKTWITLKEKLSEVGVNLTSLSQNLIDEVWTEDNGRPPVNVRFAKSERTKQMEPILNFQVPAEGLELVILLHTQY